jgi:hypothetical protein
MTQAAHTTGVTADYAPGDDQPFHCSTTGNTVLPVLGIWISTASVICVHTDGHGPCVIKKYPELLSLPSPLRLRQEHLA